MSPLLLMGISMVAALLMILSAIMKSLQHNTKHWYIKMESCSRFDKTIYSYSVLIHTDTKNNSLLTLVLTWLANVSGADVAV